MWFRSWFLFKQISITEIWDYSKVYNNRKSDFWQFIYFSIRRSRTKKYNTEISSYLSKCPGQKYVII